MAPSLLGILLIIVGGIFAAVLAVFLILFAVKFFKGFFRAIGWVITHIFRFITGMISDVFRMIGAIFAAIALSLLVVLNVVIARWSNADHFGRALKDELSTASRALYRVCIGHPAKFLLLNGLTEGMEVRVANAVAAAPGPDKPSKRTGEFEGYTIVGSLKGGGSGGKLFVAEPDDRKRASFERRGITDVDQVVIKSFSLKDGSSMPQIVRESRALEAAKKLGLVLEHELSDSRFYYAMPYVPGESLGTVTQRLHAESGPGGLAPRQLRYTLGLIGELLNTLSVYHRGGLWHKDIKPDNIIVNGDHATLVDLGLVTPLRSAMTLTTHGTEYFRDPEMVRMALRGAKVHEVDGVKFDIYGAGAVLFSAIENSFPAHGGLSQISKRCPDALRWIIRRSMTELTQRYSSAEEMLTDLRVVMEADDPFALKPKDLPSMGGAAPQPLDPQPVGAPAGEPDWVFAGDSHGAAHRHAAAPPPPPPPHRPGQKTRFKVQDWLTGRYTIEGIRAAHQPAAEPPRAHAAAARTPVPPRRRSPLTAAEQRAQAQARVRAAQQRVRERRATRQQKFSTNPNRGVMIGVVAVLLILGSAGVAARLLVSGSPSIARSAWSIPVDVPQATIKLSGDRDSGSFVFAGIDQGLLIANQESSEPGRTKWFADPTAAMQRIFSNGSDRGTDTGALIIHDLSVQDGPRTRERADWFTGLLETAGYEPLDATAEDSIELQARARAMVGVTGLDNEETVRLLRSWLIESDTLAALVWVSSAKTPDGEIDPDRSPSIFVITEFTQSLRSFDSLRADAPLPPSLSHQEGPIGTVDRRMPVGISG